jgi:hypothetical protein
MTISYRESLDAASILYWIGSKAKFTDYAAPLLGKLEPDKVSGAQHKV